MVDWGALANASNDLIFGIWNGINQTRNLNHQQNIANAELQLAEKQYYSNLDYMNKNFGLQQEAFNYNKAQAELTRQREDNAFQRRVADYVKSGFSPLAAQGVASSSQAPTLTAPQLDPSGVNEATKNRMSAYDKMIEVNQNKLQQSNFNSELKLKNMQLQLAQIETAKSIFDSVFDAKRTNQEIRRLEFENEHYKKYGFRDTTLQSLLSSILKNINIEGKNPGEVIADGVNDILNSPDETPIEAIDRKVIEANNNKIYKNLNNEEKIDKFVNLLQETSKGHLSFYAIDKFDRYAWQQFGFETGLKNDRFKSLSEQEINTILDNFYKYRNSIIQNKTK